MSPISSNSKLQGELDARILALELELCDLKRRRNELSLIFQLPLEILCQILTSSIPRVEYEEWSNHEDRMKPRGILFSHVSHGWRTISLGCSEIWGRLNVGPWTRGEALKLALARARDGPIYLDLLAQDRKQTNQRLSDDTASALGLISPARYQALDFYIDDEDVRFFRGGRATSFDNLVVLGLELYGSQTREFSIFLESKFPRLRQLTVRAETKVPLDCGPLRSIHLTDVDVELVGLKDGNPSDLLAIFKRSTGLQEFGIRDTVCLGSTFPPEQLEEVGGYPDPIELPELARLTLALGRFLGPKIVKILSSIFIPAYVSLDISYSNSFADTTDVMAALQQACGFLAPVQLKLARGSVWVSDSSDPNSGSRCHTGNRSIELEKPFHEPFTLHIWEWGWSFANLRVLKITRIEETLEGTAPSRFWSFLAETALETLNVESTGHAFATEFLASFKGGRTAQAPWLFLQSLTSAMETSETYERVRHVDPSEPALDHQLEHALDLVDALKARVEAGAVQLGTLEFGIPFGVNHTSEHISQILACGAGKVLWTFAES